MFDDQYVDCLAKNYPEIELMNINNVNSYTDSLTLTIYIFFIFPSFNPSFGAHPWQRPNSAAFSIILQLRGVEWGLLMICLWISKGLYLANC